MTPNVIKIAAHACDYGCSKVILNSQRNLYDATTHVGQMLIGEEPDESALLIAFAHAAAKAQEIERLLQETVIGAEVVADSRNRSFDEIAKEIDKLPLGPLKQKYLGIVGKQVDDPIFEKMWKD